MKNFKLFPVFFLLVLSNELFSQVFSWAKNQGSTAADIAYSTAVDASGNVYTTGTFSNTCNFDIGATNFSVTSAGGNDIFLEKRNSTGVLQWVKTIGTTGGDLSRTVFVDGSGNIYIGGFFQGTADFDPGVGVFNMTSNAVDAFILKLNSSGNFVWSKAFTGPGNETVFSLVVNSAGDVYTTGTFNGIADFDPSAATFTLSSGGANLTTTDIYISKINSSGNFVWAKQIGGTSNTINDIGTDIALDASGNVVAVGNTTGSVDLDPGAGTFIVSTASNDYQGFYLKLNASGLFQFGGVVDGSTDDKINGVAIDASGSIIFVGQTNSPTIDLDPGAGTDTYTKFPIGALTNNDFFIVKLTSAGTYSWGTLIGNTLDDFAQKVCTDASGNIYVTGTFQYSVDLNPGTGTDIHTSTSSTYDIFDMKLTSAGAYVWGIDIGGTGSDLGNDIAVDASGNIFTCGYFGGTVDFDPGAGVTNLVSQGSTDAYVFKLTPCNAPTSPTNTTPAANLNKCSGSTTTLTIAGAGTFSWYASPTSTTAIGTGTNYITPTLAAGTFTYYASAFTCTNSATRTAITITVTATPTVAVSNQTICSGVGTSLSASGATTYSWNTGATTAAISVTPAITTVYTVTGANAGCTNTKTVSITVKTTPTVAVSNQTMCSGGQSVLTASGATTYSWSTGSTAPTTTVYPSSFTTYTVVGTTTGCANTKTVSVSVVATPTVSTALSPMFGICAGQAATLTANGASTYSWSNSATTTSITVSPTVTTMYTVTGTSNGCSMVNTINVPVNPTPTLTTNSPTICAGQFATCSVTASGGATSYTWNTGSNGPSLTVGGLTVTSTFTVIGSTGASGCLSAPKIVTVTVNGLPNVSVSSSTICSGSTGTLVASGASTYSWNTGATGANLAVNPTVYTTYTVTGTSAAGCVKTATASVTVGSAPSIAANSASICTGSSVTLTASGVNTYTWNTSSNSPSITVNPTSTTVYTVSGNLAGCAATAVKVVTVTVNSLPIVTLGTISSPLCVNNAAVPLSGSPSGGMYSGAGVSGSNFDPFVSGAGTFTVTYNYTNANNCSASDTKTVNVSLCTSLTEAFEVNDGISIYPNPANNFINIKSGIEVNALVQIMDVTGKIVKTQEMSNGTTEINLSDLSKGLYIISVKTNDKQLFNSKLIKE